MTSPLSTLLAGTDPARPAAEAGGAAAYRYAHDAVLALALAVLVRRPRAAMRLTATAWPFVLFLAYAAVSLAWSDDRAASLKASLNALPLVAAGAALPLSLGPERAARALLQTLALAVLGSVLTAILLPRFGVTGAGDLVGAGPPGSWRGLYVHKNVLGHAAGLAAAALASPGGGLVRPRALRWAGLGAALLCLLMSRSASGVVSATTLLLAAALVRAPGLWRPALAGLLLAASALAVAARDAILATGLALLGRDGGLSGRTAIWRWAGELGGERRLFGWGLDVSASPDATARLQTLFGVDHVHNAALDVFLNLGSVGVGLWLLAIVAAFHPVPQPNGMKAKGALGLLLAGWVLSGLTEDMGVRLAGPVALTGAAALWSLYALRAAPAPRVSPPRWRFAAALPPLGAGR